MTTDDDDRQRRKQLVVEWTMMGLGGGRGGVLARLDDGALGRGREDVIPSLSREIGEAKEQGEGGREWGGGRTSGQRGEAMDVVYWYSHGGHQLPGKNTCTRVNDTSILIVQWKLGVPGNDRPYPFGQGIR